MVVLSKIYTKTGDDGTTGLVGGERRPKYDLRIEAVGAVEEANSAIGLARAHLDGSEGEADAALARLQNDLFDLGSDLATPPGRERAGREALRIAASQVERLESEIDRFNGDLEPLRSFVLPGGNQAAAALHLARTISRRAERLMWALAAREPDSVGGDALRYANRLSDLLFVVSRWINGRGAADVLWVPGQNR
ncbi:MAG TPA: cob(I)yrinic acid a,c-diamide adenosyltransferase [Afifellaceae bacterium]|nr:cob(I)yrinic acid a,c-diamide adenosyltransferase [Afifellaceae bacterium]